MSKDPANASAEARRVEGIYLRSWSCMVDIFWYLTLLVGSELPLLFMQNLHYFVQRLGMVLVLG